MNQSVAGAETTSGGARSEGKEQAQGHRPRVRRSTWLYGLAILIALSIVSFNIIRPIVVLPRIAPSPGFALVDSAGQPVTSEDRRGFLTLYSFSYLDCDVQCPQSVDDIAALREAVAAKLPAGTPLSFVTISLDPERDTPARLAAAEAAHALPAGAPGWLMLTGDPARTRATVGGGFGVYFSPPDLQAGDDSPRVKFDPRYVLVDHLGIMRAEYRTGAPDPTLIARDVNLLLEEAANSDGVVRLGYEAAHLFLCYPR